MFSKEKWHCSDAFSRTAPIGFSHSGFPDFTLNVYYVYQFSDLQIQLTTSPKPKPDDPDSVAFGHCFSDHMMEVSWSASSGWGKPQISPVHNLNLHPGAKCFHYATEVNTFSFSRILLFKGSTRFITSLHPPMSKSNYGSLLTIKW